MATVLAYTESKVYSRYNAKNYFLLFWTHLHETDATPPATKIPSSVKFKVKVTGGFGTGGHVRLQGSIDGLTWSDLNDSTNTLIDLVAAGEKEVLKDHVFAYIRPYVQAGTSVDVTVTLLAIP